jgi:hypothetical protein
MRFFILLPLMMAIAACGCEKKKAKTVAKTEPAPAEAAPPPVNPGNTNYQGGAGAVQNVRQAARRAAKQNDLHQLGLLISQTTTLDNRMPSAAEIKQSLQRDAPNILKEINEGIIILTDTKNMRGLWAYEVDADRAGGLVLVGGTASRASADEVKQYLANK